MPAAGAELEEGPVFNGTGILWKTMPRRDPPVLNSRNAQIPDAGTVFHIYMSQIGLV